MRPPVSDPAPPRRNGSLDVFVSYAHEDADMALQITLRLRSCGFSVFIDDDLPGGAPRAARHAAAAARARVVLLVWSWAAKTSDFDLREVDAAKAAGTLLPVTIDDAPFSAWFRALRVRPLVRDGKWDEKCFQQLRRDIFMRCGRNAPAEGARSDSPMARDLPAPGTYYGRDYQARGARAEESAGSIGSGHPDAGTTRTALVHAIQALRLPGTWLLDEAPATVLARARKYAAAWPYDPVGLIDLAVPGVTDSFLIIWAEHLELAARDGPSQEIRFGALIDNEVTVDSTGPGYRASIRVAGDILLPVTGKQQITLLYETLYSVREELTWRVSVLPRHAFEEAVSNQPGGRSPAAAPAVRGHHCRVFLCHSSGDKPAVRELYRRLREKGFDPWFDEEKLKPGQDWEYEIATAVRAVDLVIVCLSKGSVGKSGYVQKEIRMVLNLADEQPEGKTFLIPARLEECEVPRQLAKWQWVDLFDPRGYSRLLSAIMERR
jgi:TIR domain